MSKVDTDLFKSLLYEVPKNLEKIDEAYQNPAIGSRVFVTSWFPISTDTDVSLPFVINFQPNIGMFYPPCQFQSSKFVLIFAFSLRFPCELKCCS